MEPLHQNPTNLYKSSSLSPKKKDLSHLLNITAKFAGSGGSMHLLSLIIYYLF